MGEWDFNKNSQIGLSPDKLTSGSKKKAWWTCANNHTWEAAIYSRSNGCGCPYCSGRLAITGINDLQTVDPLVASEWNYKKNNNLLPSMVMPSSGKKVWWICSFGHEWNATIGSRHQGAGCPVCAGKKIISGVNDLVTLNPLLAKEWDYEKNSINPGQISPNSHKKVWWVCQNGHNWQAEIKSRHQGNGCPLCHQSFKISFPEQVIYFYVHKYFNDAIWHYYGKELCGLEIDVYIPSRKIGIEYDGQYYHQNTDKDRKKDNICDDLNIVLKRIREPMCPKYQSNATVYGLVDLKEKTLEEVICALLQDIGVQSPHVNIGQDYIGINELISHINVKHSLLDQHQDIANEWNYTKNGVLRPEHLSSGSNKRVWWVCAICGYEWITSVNNRVFGTGCPKCARQKTGQVNSTPKVGQSLEDLFPNVAADWNYDRNTLSPCEVSPYSNKKVWWICNAGHEWEATVSNRTQGRGCLQCFRAKQKLVMKKELGD